MDYDKAQRDQIWGFTLPWEQTKHADYDLIGNFPAGIFPAATASDAGFRKPCSKSMTPKPVRKPISSRREFAALRPLLADYLSTVFARSNFETEFSPRGVYFASGTRKGCRLTA